MNVIPHSSSSPKAKEAEDSRRLHNEAQEEKADSSSESEEEEERKQRQEEMLVKSFDTVRPNPVSSRRRLEERCASKNECSAEEVNTEHNDTKIYRKSLTFASLIFDICCSLISSI